MLVAIGFYRLLSITIDQKYASITEAHYCTV